MKCLTAALFLMILTVLAACTKSTQGNSSAPVSITLSYATTESGQLELLNPLTGYSYMKITTGTKTVGIAPGTTVKAVCTPASGDTNTPAFWIDSRSSSNMAAGANIYSFKVSGTANIQMHLSAPENTVQILAPSHGIISWTLNSTHGQVSVGDPTTSFVVRASVFSR